MNTISSREPSENEFRNRRTVGQFRLSESHPRVKVRLITSSRNQAKGKKKERIEKAIYMTSAEKFCIHHTSLPIKSITSQTNAANSNRSYKFRAYITLSSHIRRCMTTGLFASR
jgi:hypothetical protein